MRAVPHVCYVLDTARLALRGDWLPSAVMSRRLMSHVVSGQQAALSKSIRDRRLTSARWHQTAPRHPIIHIRCANQPPVSSDETLSNEHPARITGDPVALGHVQEAASVMSAHSAAADTLAYEGRGPMLYSRACTVQPAVMHSTHGCTVHRECCQSLPVRARLLCQR